MIREHYLAVRDLIPDGPDYKRYFGSVPKSPSYPYVVVWGDLGTSGSESLADVVDQLELRPRVTYVGSGYEQVMWLADKIRPLLNRARPAVAGWSPGRMRQSPLRPPEEDNDVVLPGTTDSYVWSAVDEFPFVSAKN